MNRAHSLFLGLAVAAVAGLTSAANAGTTTYTDVTTPFTVGFSSTPTDINTNVTVPQWNPALFPGQGLQSADVTMAVNLTGSITLKNNSTTDSETLFATTTSVGTLDGFTPFNVSFSTPSETLAPGASITVPVTGSTNFDSGLITGAGLPAYVGSGNVSFPYGTVTSLSATGGGGNVGITQATSEDATLTVTYTYGTSGSGVPEPASLGLLGVGAVGLMLRRRRAAR